MALKLILSLLFTDHPNFMFFSQSLGLFTPSFKKCSGYCKNLVQTSMSSIIFSISPTARLHPGFSQCNKETLIHALVTSQIDYCNAILSGISNNLLHGLQIIQNAVAHIVTYTKASDHITPSIPSWFQNPTVHYLKPSTTCPLLSPLSSLRFTPLPASCAPPLQVYCSAWAVASQHS